MVTRYRQYNPQLKRFSQDLRGNMTDAERLLWSKIKGKQIVSSRWYRQKPLASFIVDFYCPAAKLVIEIDGSQHFEDAGIISDQERDADLRKLGLSVLRFTNFEILRNIDGVLFKIEEVLKNPS